MAAQIAVVLGPVVVGAVLWDVLQRRTRDARLFSETYGDADRYRALRSGRTEDAEALMKQAGDVDGGYAACDGMPLPGAAWQLRVDESGCSVWREPTDFTGCCGCYEGPDAG